MVAQCFDLSCGLDSAVGRDLLEYAHARFDPFDVSSILRGPLGGLIGNHLAHPLLVLEPSSESAEADSADDRDSDDDQEEDKH